MTEQFHQGQGPLPYTDQIASPSGKKLLVIAAQIVVTTETMPPACPGFPRDPAQCRQMAAKPCHYGRVPAV
jgi:hypothetical protein